MVLKRANGNIPTVFGKRYIFLKLGRYEKCDGKYMAVSNRQGQSADFYFSSTSHLGRETQVFYSFDHYLK